MRRDVRAAWLPVLLFGISATEVFANLPDPMGSATSGRVDQDRYRLRVAPNWYRDTTPEHFRQVLRRERLMLAGTLGMFIAGSWAGLRIRAARGQRLNRPLHPQIESSA